VAQSDDRETLAANVTCSVEHGPDAGDDGTAENGRQIERKILCDFGDGGFRHHGVFRITGNTAVVVQRLAVMESRRAPRIRVPRRSSSKRIAKTLQLMDAASPGRGERRRLITACVSRGCCLPADRASNHVLAPETAAYRLFTPEIVMVDAVSEPTQGSRLLWSVRPAVLIFRLGSLPMRRAANSLRR